MNKARFREYGLAGQFYWTQKQINLLAMHSPGLPYVTDIEPVTPFLCKQGFSVVQIQYKGTYDSDGTFSPDSAVETLFDIEKLIKENKSIYDLRQEQIIALPKSIKIIVAHSFGTHVAFKSILKGLSVDVAILFSPMLDYGRDATTAGLKVDLSKQVRHISKALPFTFRLNSIKTWEDFFLNNKSNLVPLDEVKGSNVVKVICVCGKKDNGIDSKISKGHVEDICLKYSTKINLLNYIEVDNGTHDVESLLTDEVKKFISKTLEVYHGE